MIEYKTKKELNFLSENIDLLKEEVLNSKGIILELMKLYAVPYDTNALMKDKSIAHYVYRSQLNLDIEEDDDSFITPSFVEGILPYSDSSRMELNNVLLKKMFPKKEDGSELNDLVDWMNSVPYEISISIDAFQTLEESYAVFTSKDKKMIALRKVLMERSTNSLFVKEICNLLNFIQNDVVPEDLYEKIKLQTLILKSIGNNNAGDFTDLLRNEKIDDEEKELIKNRYFKEENEKDAAHYSYRDIKKSLSKSVVEKEIRKNLRKILENETLSESSVFVEYLVHSLKKVKSAPIIEVAKKNNAYKDCLLNFAWNYNVDFPVDMLQKELGISDKEIKNSLINQIQKQMKYAGGLSAFHSFIKLTENEDQILKHVLSSEVFNAVAISNENFNESRDNTDGNIPLEKVIEKSYQHLSQKLVDKTITMQDVNLFHYMTWMWLPIININLKNSSSDAQEKDIKFKDCVNQYYLPMISKLEKEFGKELEFLQFLNTSENIIYLQELNLKDEKAIPENIKFLLEDPVWTNQNENEIFMKFNEFSKKNHQLGYKEIPFNRLVEIEGVVSKFPSRYMVLSMKNNEEMFFLENRYAEIIKSWVSRTKEKVEYSSENEKEDSLTELLDKFEKMGNMFVNIKDRNVFLRNANAVLFNYFPRECEIVKNHSYFQIPENQKILNENIINIVDNEFVKTNFLSEEKASVFMDLVQKKIKELEKDGVQNNVNAISNCIYYSYKNNAPNFPKDDILFIIKNNSEVLLNLIKRIATNNLKEKSVESNIMLMRLLNPEIEINTSKLMSDMRNVVGESLEFKVLEAIMAPEKTINLWESVPKDKKNDFIQMYKMLTDEEKWELCENHFIDEIFFKSLMRDAIKNKQKDALNELLIPLMLVHRYEKAEICKVLKPGFELLNEENKALVTLCFYGKLGGNRFSDEESKDFIIKVSSREYKNKGALIKNLNGQQTNLMEHEKELVEEFILCSVKEMVNMGYENINEELLISYFKYYIDLTPKMLDIILSEPDSGKKNSFIKGLLESEAKNVSDIKWSLIIELVKNRNDALSPEIMATLEYHRKGNMISDVSEKFAREIGDKFIVIPSELNDVFFKLYDDMAMKLQVPLMESGVKKVLKKF